ncbi:MAG: tetratricopeptide repeat protein [Myxococcaceae bacterium]|nr:tetratricopeptide repeat protein [Myxococcaceae bacterium]
MKVVRIAALALAFSVPAAAADAKKKGAGADKPGPAAAAPKKDEKKAASREDVRKGPAKFSAALPKLEDVERERIADQKRDESIESLKKIIPKIEDGSPQKAELLFQLSELYWEKSKYLNRKEMLKFQEDEKKVDEARNKGEKVADAKEDHRESELYRSETMRLYETVLREYPSYDRKDEVLFALGYNLYEIGKREQAVKRYEELIKGYPNSKFIGDGYVQLGNHYFDVANNLSKAKEMYEKAFQQKEPKIKSYALYKLAWCDFNAGEHEKALKKLQDVIEYVEKQEKRKDMTDLKTEALNDSVTMFVQLNRADDAIAYFKAKAGKKTQLKLITRMGYALYDAGHHENSIKTFRLLLSDNPVAEAAPDFTQQIIKGYEGLRQRDNVKAETKKMAELYRPGSAWWKANESKKEVLRNGFNVAEEGMRTVVTEYHQEAQKTKQAVTYRLAGDIYKQYVDAFATGDDEAFISDYAFNMKFYYAEILWALEEWEKAAQQYDGLVAFKIPNRETAKEISQEKYRKSAAYAAILAYNNLVKIERGQMVKAAVDDKAKIEENKKKNNVQKAEKVVKRSVKELQEQPLTKWEGALASSCDSYNKLFPNNEDEIEVRYQAAVLYYDRNHFVEAAQRFTEIIGKWPEDKRSADAADLTMSVLEEKEEWLELNKSSRAFLANKKLIGAKQNAEFAKRTGQIVEGSQYKYVDIVVYKKEKKVKEAAEMFLAFVHEFPKSENADRALTYSMLIFQDANELDRGITTGERVLKEYPGTNFELKARYSLAKFYEKIADFEKSAAMYEDFIAAYDAWAGPKAVGYDNIKDLLKKEKEQKDKDAKAAAAAAKGKAAAKDAPKETRWSVGQIAAAPPKEKEKLESFKKERADLTKEAEKEDWVSAAQFNAGLWWEGLGKSDKAIAAYNRYIARFKEKKDVPEIALNIGLILEKDKKYPEAMKTFEAFATTYAKDPRVKEITKFDLKYRAFLDNKILKNNAEMDRIAKDIVAAYPKLSAEDKKDERAKLAYAHTRFYLYEPTWNAYTAVTFKNIKTLKNDLKTKTQKIQEIEKGYTDILAIGNGEYGVAALTRIGLAYGDMSQNFLDSPTPKGFDEDQTDMYRTALEEKAFPLEEKALEALDKALAKSYELSIYNEWTLLAQDKVNKYKPGLYAKVREVAYRGAEFFWEEPLDKTGGTAPVPAPSKEGTPAPAEPAKANTTAQAAPAAGGEK